MKVLYKIAFISTLLLFVGCSSEDNKQDEPQATNRGDVPASPLLNNKEKTPPSIPVI